MRLAISLALWLVPGFIIYQFKMNSIKYWVDNARWISFPQSLLPALVAVALAWHENSQEGFVWWLGLLAVVGVVLLHFGMNLADDYFDYKYKKSGNRTELASKGIRARVAKCPYLVGEGGTSTMKDLFIALSSFCLIALALGIIIFVFRGWTIAYIAAIGALLGIEYSAPPIRLSYHGLGELTIGLIFGPVVMAGVYVAAGGVLSASVFFLSVPVGLLVTNIVYVHSVMDYEADKAVGKCTLASILVSKKMMLLFVFVFTLLPFLIVTAGVFLAHLSPWYLFVWLCIPTAIILLYWMVWFNKDSKKEFKRNIWMGPVQQWDKITEAGIEWFMLRWLASRNLVMFFSLILIIVGILS